MRIAQIAPPWLAVPPRGYGGVELVVALLADGLVERGHRVTLFATGDSRTKAELDAVFDRAPGAASINDPWYDTVHTIHAFRRLDEFDLLHVHSPWSALAAASVVDTPSVHTVHGPVTPNMRRLFVELSGWVSFVAISEAERRQMPELSFAGVVHNGVDVARYPLVERKDDFLLFLGRAAPEKGPVRAALAATAAGLPLVMAMKIADPKEAEHWEREVVPRLPPGTQVLPEVGWDEKIDLLSRAKAVLFPIDWEEPFGLVMAEAMACGTPVIATPRGSVPEVVADGETGFVVSVDGYAEEAAAVLRRIDDIDPATCRRRVVERFSKDAMVRGYEAVFEGIVSERRSRQRVPRLASG